MRIYKGDKSCDCSQAQLNTMKKAGWSTKKPVEKSDDTDATDNKPQGGKPSGNKDLKK